MDKEKVLDLAKLARVKIDDAEAEELSREFDSILDYVGQIKSIEANGYKLTADSFPIWNIMREDTEGHEPGIYTEKILSQAPSREGNYVKVKKIL